MKKRLFSLLLILALALSLCAAVHAEEPGFVYDESGALDAGDEQVLEELGARIFAETETAVCVCYTDRSGEWDELRGFAETFYNEHIGAENGILLVHFVSPDGGSIVFYKTGDKLDSLSSADLDEIMQAYNSSDNFAGGAHNYMNLVYARLRGAADGGEVTAESSRVFSTERQLDRVVDLAGVIDSDRLRSLNAMADEVSERYQCDVAVAFVSSLGGKDVVKYSDLFFLENGYGMGASRDGILLLISVGDREFNESTSGSAIAAFTDYGLQNYIEPSFTRYLLNGRDDWAGAAEQFIRDADDLLRQAEEGHPYDYTPQRTRRSFKESAPMAAVISAVVGFFSGGIPAGAMKRKLKSVAKEYGAANYARGGLNLRYSDDRFLYANVSKTPIPRESTHSSGGGGSSVHFSSSGRSHGGSHGKF